MSVLLPHFGDRTGDNAWHSDYLRHAIYILALLAGLLMLTGGLLAQERTAAPSPRELSIEQWHIKIEQAILRQNFRMALALCLDAERNYPEELVFRNLEFSIREYLEAEQYSSENPELVAVARDSPPSSEPRPSFKQRLATQAEQDPFLAVTIGAGLHLGGSIDKMKILNPYSTAAIDFYFSPSFGLNLFYYDAHWGLPLEFLSGSTVQTPLYTMLWGGSLRFRNKFKDFFKRSALSFTLDLGIGVYDIFSNFLTEYQPTPIILLGFAFSDRPFYHLWGIKVLAGLQLDMKFSILLNLQESSSVVQTGNWELILWQSLGLVRLGFSYRGGISEYYDSKQVFFVEHHFSFLLGLEWRTNFR